MKGSSGSLLLSLWVLAAATGCYPTFVSDYDPVTDAKCHDLKVALTELRQEVADAWGPAEAANREFKTTYPAFGPTYGRLRAETTVLLERAAGLQKNQATVIALRNLKANLDDLPALHSVGRDKTAFDLQMETILQQLDQVISFERMKQEFRKK